MEIVTPGPLTTAKRVLHLALGDAIRTRDLPFDEVLDEVVSGRADAGLLIHEGQLTYADAGLAKLLDLGLWWDEHVGLPLPLGLVGIRRNVERRDDVSAVLRDAIAAGLANRDQALAYAMQFGRGIDEETADRFVSMYVNDLTLDMGDRGRAAVTHLLGKEPECAGRAVILSAVRTPVGRYGGGLAGVRPDDLAGLAIAAAVERAGVPPDEIEDVVRRLRESGGRGQPERRAHGRPPRGAPRLCRRRHREPSVRVRSRGDRRCVPRGRRRRRRPLRRRRRRIDVTRTVRDGEAGRPVPAR